MLNFLTKVIGPSLCVGFVSGATTVGCSAFPLMEAPESVVITVWYAGLVIAVSCFLVSFALATRRFCQTNGKDSLFSEYFASL
jgi:hypothetical protein